MNRGELWWADLPRPAGRRLVLLLSRDEAYLVRHLVMAAPATTRRRHLPTELRIGREDGAPRSCVVNLDMITVIPRKCLAEKAGAITEERTADLDEALLFALGIAL